MNLKYIKDDIKGIPKYNDYYLNWFDLTVFFIMLQLDIQ